MTVARLRLAQGPADATVVGDRILVRLANDTSERCVRAYERIAPVYDVLDAAYEWSWKRGCARG